MIRGVYTIPPNAPFIDILAEGLWKEADGDPFKLAEIQVLLPTRRACRYLREAFPKVTGSRATLLPRMQPLGDLDEAELYFSPADDVNPDIPPAIGLLRRQMLLTQLVRKGDPHISLDQAAQLATALGALLDQVQIERRDFSDLHKLAPEHLAKHWQQTIKFLEILTKHWPKVLAEEQAIDPADRRNRLIEAQTKIWETHPPKHPVIAAGSTGSLPATGDLLRIIAQLPQGSVVLPGLDQELDEEAWQAIEETHPQYTIKSWLDGCKIARTDVKLWPTVKVKPSPRVRLLQESMRPAAVTDQWRELDTKKISRAALKGLSCLTLYNAQEEAQTIALVLRGALETPEKTAALVTADRGLAERVAEELTRWEIRVNDSAGMSLAAQPVGSFLLNVLNVSSPQATAIDCLSLLKHPLAACGLEPAICRAKAREAELLIWRASRPDRKESEEIRSWIDQLKQKFQSLRQSWNKSLPLLERLRLHIELAEQLAASDKETGKDRLWHGETGEAAANWLDEWQSAASGFPSLTGDEYVSLFGGLLRSVTMRPRYGLHARLSILGPLEARLLQADMTILGGLNEGSWPPEATIDPWMSRPMKRDFGLPLPERRIGLSAHDFVQLASSPEVIITRARRAGGAPTVPSRFLLQLETVLRALGYDEHDLNPENDWAEWAQRLDEPAAPPKPCLAPEPRPSVAVRPRALRVTDISTWRRNPYAIYAKWILGLRKLEPLESEASAADKGMIIHAALEKFLRAYLDKLPPQPVDELLKIGREVFAPYHDQPQVAAFWWPRFERIACWFIEREQERREANIKNLKPEAEGSLTLTNDFILKGRADRIDQLPDGMLEIIDYKTGAVPTQVDVRTGYEPQLPLLALIASEGGFKGLPPAPTSTLSYWRLTGGGEAGEVQLVKEPVDVLMKKAREGLEQLIKNFDDLNTPYQVSPKPGLQLRYDDYAHLARKAEWGRAEGEA